MNEIEDIIRCVTIFLLLFAAGFGGLTLISKKVESRHRVRVESTPVPDPAQIEAYRLASRAGKDSIK
jgi:hypothetical protein